MVAPRNIAVLGAGSWGPAVASTLAGAGSSVTLWARRADQVAELQQGRNPRFLGDRALAPELRATGDFRTAVDGERLAPGRHRLEVEVTNLMANRIRCLDRQGVEWRRFYDINFVTVQYQPFDASGWEPLESGLLGPVRLIPARRQGLD